MTAPRPPASDPTSAPASTPRPEVCLRAGGRIEIRAGRSAPARVLAPDDADYDRVLAFLIESSVGVDAFRELPERSVAPAAAVGARDSVGVATMTADGSLEMMLRCEEQGAIAEAMLVVAPTDPRSTAMLLHLGGAVPGESCAIKPFPG